MEVASQWGLTVSLAKTRGLAVGVDIDEEATVLVRVQGGVIDMVEDFDYLGSSLSGDGDITNEVYIL